MRLLIAGLIVLITSCENKKDTTVSTSSNTVVTNPVKPGDNDQVEPPIDSIPASDPLPPVNGQCYMQTSGRDTTWLQLNRQGNTVTGRMLFDNYQIDGSHGNVKGTISGNIMELWYDLESEGMRSTRQLFFKEDGDQLLWGKGIQVVRNDSTLFKDPAANTYSAHLFMRKAACRDSWQ